MAIDSIHHVLIDRRREVSVTGGAPIVAGSVESDVVALTLQAPEQWEGLDLALTFYGGENKVTVAWDGESEVTVPWEAVQAVGWLGVALEGVEVDGGETVQRSLVARKDMLIRVVEAGPTDGVDPERATQDLVDQAIAATAAANAAASSANVAATSADGAAQTATEAAGQVYTAIYQAEEAADDANAAAQAATEAMEGIETYTQNVLRGSASGAIATVDDAWPSTLLGLTVYGNSVQDGTPTPETLVPIRSVAGAACVTAGRNVAMADWAQRFVTAVDVPAHASVVTYDGRECLKYGASAGYGCYDACNFTIGTKFKENTRYTVSLDYLKTNTGAGTIGIRYTDGTQAKASISDQSLDTWTHVSFTTAAGKTVKYIFPWYTSGVSYIDLATWQIEEGTTATAYEPAQGTAYPLTLVDDQGVAHELRSLPDGTRDELAINADGSGTLRATTGTVVVDGTNKKIYSLNTYNNAKHALIDMGNGTLINNVSQIHTICDRLPGISGNDEYIGNTGIANANNRFLRFICDEIQDMTSGAEVNTWLQSNPLTVIYTRSTPATYHIPAINMPALPATVSNAWIDATDSDGAAIGAELEIGYRRDVNVVINRLEEAIADLVSA